MDEDVESTEPTFLLQVLERNGYQEKPDFVVIGRLPVTAKTSLMSRMGTGISAVAAFSDGVVHVFGRRGTESGNKLLSSDQILVREISHSELEGIDFTLVEGVGAVVTLSVRGKGGFLQKSLVGGDVVVTIRKADVDSTRPLIEQLRSRI
jgi:hypothetical protein